MSKSQSAKKKKESVQSFKGKKSISSIFENYISRKYTGVVIAAIYFVVVGLVSFIFHTVGDYGIETDFFWGYVPSAKKVLSGEIPMDAFRGPLYPIVLAVFGYILSDFFHAGILIAVLSASIVIYVSFDMLRKIFSPVISFFVTSLLAVNTVFIQYSYSAGTDMFFNALAALTLFFFFKNKELNYKNLILAAFFGGLSYLTRYNGIFLASFIFIILFVNYWKISWTSRVKSSLLFGVVFLLTFSPWGFYCLSEKGSFFYNENYKNIAFEVYGKGKISWDDFWFNGRNDITSLAQVVTKDVGLFFSTVTGNISDHFLKDMDILVGWHLGAIVILGFFLLIISKPHKNWIEMEKGYYLVNLFFFILLLLIFYSERFSLFLIPFYLSIAVQPFFVEKMKISKLIPNTLKYVLLSALIVITFLNSYSFNSENINSGPTELLTLGEWYEENVSPEMKGKTVAARKAHVAYYLNMDFKLLPMADSYDELLSKLKESKVDYLYFGVAEASLRNEFRFLLDRKGIHPGLEVVVYFNNPPSVLYRVMHE
jgi:Dolichyl-phosphate-mannose-protein mannosyltransferase